jgi:ribonuclease P protein component
MLAKKERLNRTEFDDCFKAGQRRHGTVLTIITLPRPSFKASVVVGKKVAKKAHDRNRLRRRVYGVLENFRSYPGWCVIVVKPTLCTLTKSEQLTAVRGEIAQGLNNK